MKGVVHLNYRSSRTNAWCGRVRWYGHTYSQQFSSGDGKRAAEEFVLATEMLLGKPRSDSRVQSKRGR